MDKINAAKTVQELKVIWSQMQTFSGLNYKIDISSINENATEFNALSLEDQKRFLIKCLDKNLLYIPLSDMESEEYTISESDKRLTKEFYKSIRSVVE